MHSFYRRQANVCVEASNHWSRTSHCEEGEKHYFGMQGICTKGSNISGHVAEVKRIGMCVVCLFTYSFPTLPLSFYFISYCRVFARYFITIFYLLGTEEMKVYKFKNATTLIHLINNLYKDRS